jgi:hypothetical protein
VALLERLQILIDADAKGAVREFDKAGAAADKLDAKLEKGSAKTSARLQSIGSRTAIGGAVVIGGLFKLAQASDEAEIQQTKLENSIRNSDQTFKNSGKGLTDLATGLQQVTAADGDAIVGAESLLVQMGLTEEQVKTVTPLVVDLSRKLGIDLDTAAKMVGKSIGGSAGALKKAGIEVDGARLKTDAFSATVDALAGSVGGFARQEGLTFAGQIAILKNNLGDLGESVGKGAAGVFGALAGDAAKAAGALNKINPAILETVGAVGATGSLAATLAGGFAFAAGKAIDFKNQVQAGNTALVKVGDDGVKSLTKVGKAASAIAGVAIVVELDQPDREEGHGSVRRVPWCHQRHVGRPRRRVRQARRGRGQVRRVRRHLGGLWRRDPAGRLQGRRRRGPGGVQQGSRHVRSRGCAEDDRRPAQAERGT